MNKKLATITMILVLTITTLIGGISIADAQPFMPTTKKTYPYVGLIPSTVGVNQEVLIHLGILTTTAGTIHSWEGLTVTVTKPDGTTQTLGTFSTDSTGGTGTSYTPTQVGTYSFKTNFPEQEVPVTYFDFSTGLIYPEGMIFEAGTSDAVNLVVTEEPIEYYSDIPLPTEFWSRPVDGQFRGWSGISGNWLEVPPNVFAPHNDAPETAHILWAKPLTAGGLAGGETGEHGMEEGDAYEGKWQNSIVMNGILYYNKYGLDIFGSQLYSDAVNAVDLRTGEELWVLDGVIFDFGQTMYFDSWNYHGVYDYLWQIQGSTYNAYDPFTGDWLHTLTDVPSGIRYTGPNGEIQILVTDYANGWMALWNQTLIGLQNAAFDFFDPNWAQGSWGKNVEGRTTNASMAYSWNVTIPTTLASANIGTRVIDDRLLGVALTAPRDKLTVWALSLKDGQEGQLLFNKDWTPPAEWGTGLNFISYGANTDYAAGGVFTLWNKEQMKYFGFSLDTGSYLWETEKENYLQSLSYTGNSQIAYDKQYSGGVSGIIYCIDIFTGERIWTYETTDPDHEYLFGNNWWEQFLFISDGKIYIGHEEHSPIDPKPRGAPFVCLDAETGDVVWRADGMFRSTEWGGHAVLADSIIAAMDTYDQRIYAIGKGPSQTTVTAPDVGVMEGSSIMIRGTVMDIAAGTTTPELAARFPNGVPAVSDESMSEWMAYVYKLFPMPTVTGVDVSIDVIDANGNFRNIGTATSDVSGFYKLSWMPDIPGDYTVIATFAGSEAYYASYAETAFVVDEAPEPTAAPEATPAPMTDTYVLGMGTAAIAAIIVIGLLILMMLRKK